MNNNLQKLFSTLYNPEIPKNIEDGASSVTGTAQLRIKLEELFQQHNIKSLFDAGCNDCVWMKVLSQYIDYKGGDISAAMVAHCWFRNPELDVIIHDITTDPIPTVDLLFVRDVAIHLTNADKQLLWKNWIKSNVPWILITHNRENLTNIDLPYVKNQLLVATANWEIAPWNFPAPMDSVDEYGPNGKCMALWHRDQFTNIL